jgi:hypothetical protein
MKIITMIAPVLIAALISCDSGGNNNSDSCDPVQIPFSPMPECVTEFFQGHWIGCDCEGVQGEFILELRNFDIDGFTGAIMGSNINWEPLSCSSITFTGQTTGVLDDMTVPDDRTLNFTLMLEGSEPEQVSCCCNDQLIVD